MKTQQQTPGSDFEKKGYVRVLYLVFLEEGFRGFLHGIVQRLAWAGARFIVTFVWYNVMILLIGGLPCQQALTLQLI